MANVKRSTRADVKPSVTRESGSSHASTSAHAARKPHITPSRIGDNQFASLRTQLLGVHKIIRRYSQLDTIAPLRAQLEYLADETDRNEFTVAVVGAFTRGKSTFINALLRAEIAPTSILPTTAVYTRISFGEEASAELFFARKETRLVSLKEAHQYVATATKRIQGLQAIHIRHPSPYLKAGLVILDAPGIESVYPEHVQVALRCLREADAAIFVFASDPILGKIECDFVKYATTQVERIFFVQTKIDLYKDWSARVQTNLEMLDGYAEITAPEIHPVSSLKMLAFQRTRSETDYQASGFDALEKSLTLFLERERVQTLARKRVISIQAAIAQLRPRLEEAVEAAQMQAKQHKQKLTLRQELSDRLVANSQTVVDESLAHLRQYQRQAQEALTSAHARVCAGYEKHVLGASDQELEKETATRLATLFQDTAKQLQQNLNRNSTQLTRDIGETIKMRLSIASKPRLAGEFVFKSPPSITLNSKVVRTGKSPVVTGVTAVIGGVFGTLLNPGVGTAIGAAIGAAIGSAVQGQPNVDMVATRQGFLAEGQQIIDRYFRDLEEQFHLQLSSWLQTSEVCIRQHVEQMTVQTQQELSKQTVELQPLAAQVARQISRLRRDLRQLADIEQELQLM